MYITVTADNKRVTQHLQFLPFVDLSYHLTIPRLFHFNPINKDCHTIFLKCLFLTFNISISDLKCLFLTVNISISDLREVLFLKLGFKTTKHRKSVKVPWYDNIKLSFWPLSFRLEIIRIKCLKDLKCQKSLKIYGHRCIRGAPRYQIRSFF